MFIRRLQDPPGTTCGQQFGNKNYGKAEKIIQETNSQLNAKGAY